MDIAMLDAQFIREHLDEVKANCRNRNVTADVDKVVELDNLRRERIQALQVVQQKLNEISKRVPQEKDQAKRKELIELGRASRENTPPLAALAKKVDEELRSVLITIPNMSHSDAPVGTT